MHECSLVGTATTGTLDSAGTAAPVSAIRQVPSSPDIGKPELSASKRPLPEFESFGPPLNAPVPDGARRRNGTSHRSKLPMRMSQHITRKTIALTFLCLLLPVGIGLMYYEFHGNGSPAVKSLVPIAYIAVAILLVRTGGIPIPAKDQRGILGGHISVSNLLKTVGCFLSSLLWVAIGLPLLNDTPVGNAVLLVPSLLLLLASGLFFVRIVTTRLP